MPSTKFVIVIPDGAADEPFPALGDRTALQAARIPEMDRVAASGIVGRSRNVPDRFLPASDVATLSLLGYDPDRYYTGRAPLEAAAMGIDLGPDDWAIRCNLMTILDGKLTDFTAGHITNAEGQALIESIQAGAASARDRVPAGRELPQPDDLSRPARRRAIHRRDGHRPAARSSRCAGLGAPAARAGLRAAQGVDDRALARCSRATRSTRPGSRRANRRRMPSGCGGRERRPAFPKFAELHRLKGAIISAVDLVRGVGQLAGWTRIDVPGATGYLDTDYAAKGRYAIQALEDHDIVCVHVEAPDEASHEGRHEAKVEALERIDQDIVGPVLCRARVLRSMAHLDLARSLDPAQNARPRPRAGGLGDGRHRAAGIRQTATTRPPHALGAGHFSSPAIN